MSLEGAYDASNVFAKIVRGELPAAKVFEDEDVLAFMDAFPQSTGHVLVISKTAQARHLLDADTEVVAKLAGTVQRVARAVRAALQPDGVTVMQFSGAAGGQTVFHLHFHVIPRWEGQPLKAHGGGPAAADELAGLAARIAGHMDAGA